VRIAGIDIGSNSVRLLVADVVRGRVAELAWERVTSRLGESMDRGELAEPAVERTLAALTAFLSRIRPFSPDAVVAAATSAVRDAGNQAAFLAAVRARLGLPVRVLAGGEEAALSWHGVRAGLDLDPGDLVVVDIGGGSTEFTWFAEGRLQTASVPAGALRLTLKGLAGLDDVLAPALARIRRSRPRVMAGVGGTVTAACAMKLGLTAYDRSRLHGQVLSRTDVAGLIERVAACSQKERAALPGLGPGRADIFPAGLAVMDRILGGLGLESLVASETGLLHGLVLAAVEPRPPAGEEENFPSPDGRK